FREATALVSVEREGVLSSKVVEIEGTNPTISLPIESEWGTNVYVSVLVLRGRLHEVPWYSFFSWGWSQPLSWYDAYKRSTDTPAPTAMIALAKPSFH